MPLMILISLVALAVIFAMAWLAGEVVRVFLPKRVSPVWRKRAKWTMTAVVFLAPLVNGAQLWVTSRT